MRKFMFVSIIIVLIFSMVGCGSEKRTTTYTLTIDISGQGSIEPPTESKFKENTVVTLKPIPDQGWEFDFWAGPDASSIASNKITMTKDMHIEVVFRQPNKVTTPQISPARGTYPAPQQVTINCNTTGAEIYYTTDGSTPDKSSPKYTGSFQITKSTTIKAIAYKSGFTQSDVATTVFTLTEGKIVFSALDSGVYNIYTVDPDGSNQVKLTSGTDGGNPAWSPDGRNIAFISDRSGNFEIYVMNAEGSTQQKITNSPATESFPAWSPDGNKIAFCKNGIFLMDADGSNQVRLTSADDEYPNWSPNGSKIAFSSWRDGDCEIYVMDADGTNLKQLTSNSANDRDPVWSPDGSKIAFYTNRNGNNEIYIMNADGSNQINLTNNNQYSDRHPCWSPDGNKIAFCSSRDGGQIFVVNSDGSNMHKVTKGSFSAIISDWVRVPID